MSVLSSRRWILTASAVIAFAFFGFFWYRETNQNQIAPTPHFLSVVTSFYPLAYFAEQVGGDFVRVTNNTPSGAEPHDYEPTPQDVVAAHKANVFIYNGGGVDPWAEKIRPELERAGVSILSMQESLQHRLNTAEKQKLEEVSATSFDPHVWLDPVLATQEVAAIRDVFIQVDPVHAETYTNNAARYIEQLQSLDTLYAHGLAQCEQHDIIVTHDAFRYVALRYHFSTHAIAGLSPEDEPSAQHLGDLISLVKERSIRTIFFESLVNPRLAETIAHETGAVTAVLNPIEGILPDQSLQGVNYDTLMKANLDALRQAMLCS